MRKFVALITLSLLFPMRSAIAISPGYEMSQFAGGILVVSIFILILIALFLIFRAIVLWYWKINKMVATLEGILEELRLANRERRLIEPKS